MHQKKINKYYFTFLILLHTGLSQEYLPTSQISLITVRENRDFSPDLIASYANQLVFVDKKNHTIGIYSNDSLRIVGGYGSSEYSFIDPVDVIIDNLAIMILDESAGRVTKFDLNLNKIEIIVIKISFSIVTGFKYYNLFELLALKTVSYTHLTLPTNREV